MNAPQRNTDVLHLPPPAATFARVRHLRHTLAGDTALFPITPAGDLDLDRLREEGFDFYTGDLDSLAEADVPRLGVLVDSFTRFIPDAPMGVRIAVLDRGGDFQIAQVDDYNDHPPAAELVRNAIATGKPLYDLVDRSRPRRGPTLADALFGPPANDDEPADWTKIRAEMRADAGRLRRARLAARLAADAQPPEPPDMIEDPLTPEAAGGLLADVAAWINSSAIVPAPELAMMASASLLAGIFGRKALTPMNGGINLYVATLLATAGGKGHPPKAIRALADKAGLGGTVANGDHTSYAALERTLRKHPSTVVVMDELGITLQDVNGRHASAPAASIRKFLLAIYDQANSRFDGRIYASADAKKNDDPIDGPALTVLGMTTPETLFAGLSETSIGDGFINRFLFATASPPGNIQPPRLDRDSAPPAALVAALQDAFTSVPRVPGKLPTVKWPVPFEGGEDGDAYRLWGEVFLWQHDHRWTPTDTGFNGRAAENTLRLATIRALSRNPSDPSVTVDDVRWGWAITFDSITYVQDGARQHLAASPHEALRKAIIAALYGAPDQTLPLSKLMEKRGVSGADYRELLAALQWLMSAGTIVDTKGRTSPGQGGKFRLNSVRTAVE